MFESCGGDGVGEVPAEAGAASAVGVAPVPAGGVDLVFDVMVRELLTEAGDALAQALLVGACVARPTDQVALATALEPHVPNMALVALLEGMRPGEGG